MHDPLLESKLKSSPLLSALSKRIAKLEVSSESEPDLNVPYLVPWKCSVKLTRDTCNSHPPSAEISLSKEELSIRLISPDREISIPMSILNDLLKRYT
jgi:hypothetical protein